MRVTKKKLKSKAKNNTTSWYLFVAPNAKNLAMANCVALNAEI